MAYTFAGQYLQVADGSNSLLLKTTPFTVYQVGTTTLATIYTSRTMATVAANPSATDGLGNMQFFAAPGRYDVLCNGSTSTVTVNPDPTDLNPIAVTVVNAGSGGDDTAAFAAAQTAAGAGGTVFVPTPPSGSYNITTWPAVQTGGQVIGSDWRRCVVNHIGSGQMIDWTANYTTIRDFTLKAGVNTTGLLKWTNSSHMVASKIELDGSAAHNWDAIGLWLTDLLGDGTGGCYYGYFQKVYAHGCRWGLYPYSKTGSTPVVNNHLFVACNFQANKNDGVRVFYAQGIELRGGDAEQNGKGGRMNAPIAATGAAGVLTGTYLYKLVPVTAAGLGIGGYTSAAVSPAGQQVVLTQIPFGPQNVVSVNIYRTAAGGADGTQKLVGSVAAGVTTFTDNVADGSLGAAVPVVDNSGNVAAESSLVLTPGIAGLLNGPVTYKATFVTGTGEGPGGATSATARPVNQQIVITGIPLGPAGTTSRNLYRTVSGGADWTQKLVATIADNTTTTYTDNIADGSLGATVPTANLSGLSTATAQQAQAFGYGVYCDAAPSLQGTPWLEANQLGTTNFLASSGQTNIKWHPVACSQTAGDGPPGTGSINSTGLVGLANLSGNCDVSPVYGSGGVVDVVHTGQHQFRDGSVLKAVAHAVTDSDYTPLTPLQGAEAWDTSTSRWWTRGSSSALWFPRNNDRQQTLADAATVVVNPALGNRMILVATTSRTIAAPTVNESGNEILLDIKNSSGGAMTTTWNATYVFTNGAWADPANGKRRNITFYYDGTSWVESTRSTVDY